MSITFRPAVRTRIWISDRLLSLSVWMMPSGHTRRTRIDVNKAAALRAQGLSYRKIAKELGVSESGLKQALDPKYRINNRRNSKNFRARQRST